MATGGGKQAKRRVPDQLRRRAIASCDRCKRRRIRCDRSEDGDASCKACLDSGILCESKVPRKQRVYGSVESLSLRYRALDALVRGLFQDEDVNDIRTIFRLAAERQIPMPDSSPDVIAADAFNHDFTPPNEPNLAPDIQSPLRWPYTIDQAVQGTVVCLPEETCIPAPHGVAHYVGPCSSFDFANAIRRLVSKRNKVLDSQNAGQDRASRLRRDFASLKTSIAMEPRIRTHPASTVRGEDLADENVERTSPHDTTYYSSNAADSQRSGSPYRKWLQGLMPPQKTSACLVETFFNKVHPDYPLFHRGTFQTRFESIWHKPSAYRYDAEPGWLCSLFMTLVFGAQSIEHNSLDDYTDLQRRFLKHVRERFQHLTLTASLANVQALLLLQLYEHNAGERNTAWTLLGHAVRMAIALGMHREGTSHHFDTIERNTRRMVWSTLYSFEQYTSLMLGRPSAIKALEVNIGAPDEAIIDGNNHPPDYFHHAMKLMDLTSKVRHFSTASSPNAFNPEMLASLLQSLNSVLAELRRWRDDLPQHLEIDWQFLSVRHRRAVLLLHMHYHHLASVLTRPYLLCKVNRTIEVEGLDQSANGLSLNPYILSHAKACLESSVMVGNVAGELSSHQMLEGVTWVDFFYIYHAIMVLSVNFLPSMQQYTGDGDAQNSVYQAQLQNMIQMCQSHSLAPTYHILSHVAIQLYYIAGLGSDRTQSAQPSDTGPVAEVRPFTEVVNPNIEAEWQHDLFMPFVEPIADIHVFNNPSTYWDFFNVSGYPRPSQDPSHIGFPIPFSDL